MMLGRRQFFGTVAAAAVLPQFSCSRARESATKWSMPGLYPGRVVAVKHPGSFLNESFQAQPIQTMMRKGMMELTGAPDWIAAWRAFFEPGDVVGVKLNPVGAPDVASCPEVFHEIIAGLNAAGIKNKDIVAYDRYRKQFLKAGFDKWLPDGVRWSWAAEDYETVQLGMDGYDAAHYMEMNLTQPGQDSRDPHVRRSHVSKFLTQQVNKLVNLPVLKHHQSAGVTLALKNLSHGSVNNVNRSHYTITANSCGIFIPAVVSTPVIRQKAVLHILDGILGMYHGGPGSRKSKYVWVNHTLYFATDPVTLDKTCWGVIDAQRVAKGMQTIALSKPDDDSHYLNCQPEHIELASGLGLGVFDEKKIERKNFDLT